MAAGMSGGHYYNDHDPQVCAWLRELIAGGHLPDGEVDERSILDVRPVDLAGYTACHFFAGIGGWAYALRLAGWPDDRPVWTGSPPCQPFSTAGRRLAADDPRHLAPHFASLVAACRPPVLFGEQVSGASVFGRAAKAAKRAAARAFGLPAWAWWDDLSVRLEAARYAVGAADIPAAGVGAPHIRQRCFFGAVRLADAVRSRQPGPGLLGQSRHSAAEGDREVGRTVNAGRGRRLADAGSERHDRLDALLRPEARGRLKSASPQAAGRCTDSRMADSPLDRRRQERADNRRGGAGDGAQGRAAGHGAGSHAGDIDTGWPGPTDCFWRDADWLLCRDGKWRPVEPGTFPLADRVPARVVRLRGYGNAIVPQAAAAFVTSFMEVT